MPRGAHYLDSNSSGMPASGKPDPDSDAERERRRRTLEKMPRQYEGIGPTTKEGIPIVLRSVSSFNNPTIRDSTSTVPLMFSQIHLLVKRDFSVLYSLLTKLKTIKKLYFVYKAKGIYDFFIMTIC